ncbi:helix-turn-helix domain-containing protein [Corynebacterium hindlerae]|uniref:helix-turn-helix domain-containing protein n=1 Tax=Corynebacterium hindlerae TaxID=699041 RepID=UPI003AAA6DF9
MPKYTPPETISDILKLSSQGLTRRQVARELCVPLATIQGILSRHHATPTQERLQQAEEHLQQIEQLRQQIWAPGMTTTAQKHLAEAMSTHAKEIAGLLRGGNDE